MDDIRTEVVSDKYTDEDNSDAFSEFQGAVLWSRRSLLYRVCFLALIPLFAIFLLGFSSPFWMKKHQVDKYRGYYNLIEKVDVSIGLWRVCEGSDFSDITDCTTLPEISSYTMACQAMLCLSFIFTVFSLIFGLYENCATRYDIDDGNEAKTKRPEMNAITAGIFGLIGVGMYGAIIIDVAKNGEGAVHWAFPVTAASVTGVIVCGILMAIANPIHSSVPSYPGQIMSLSRQNSLRIREPSIQDRLVVANESVVQAAGGPSSATVYGVTSANFDAKDPPFLQRSESCLSSHMSSPDVYTASTHDDDLPHVHIGTHIVETHDTNLQSYDTAKRQTMKQQLQNRTAQRRSWHFDDRNGAYVVADLINNRPLPSDANGQRAAECMKPPVPPRRDKVTSPTNPNRPSMTQTLHPIPDETIDLMVLDDPVVIAPDRNGQNKQDVVRSEGNSTGKINTNPFIEENPMPVLPLGQNSGDLQRSTVSSGSWENQPWPDPPSDTEILGQTLPVVPKNNSSTCNGPTVNTPPPATNNVPESLQYQPQNYASLSRKKSHAADSKPSRTSPEVVEKSDSPHLKKPARTTPQDRPMRGDKKSGHKNSASSSEAHVPVMKEYDNPLFKSQPQGGDRTGAFEEDFSLQLCESTSFVHPPPVPPNPPSYYAVVDAMQCEPFSYKRHSGHHAYSPIIDDRENTQRPPRSSPHENNRDAPPAYSRHGKPHKDDSSRKHSKEKSRSHGKHHQHQNGGVKSRPRQVKREHQQRRGGHPDAGNGHKQPPPPSPRSARYGSSPDLVSKSPRLARRRPDSAGPMEDVVYVQGDYNRNISTRAKQTPEYTTGHYGYDVNRQSPYYNTAASSYRHWGDSDL